MDEEDARIRAQVKEALSKSPAWNKKGFLRLSSDNWNPLSAVASNAPTETGLYALGLPVGVVYDGGVSRIVYLGSAKNLRNRLTQHKSKSRNYVVELLQEKFPEGLSATWWPIPGFNRKFLYGMEGEALWTFESTFGVVPICNLDVPEFFEGEEYCEGLVQIPPCQVGPLITLEALANRIERVLVRKELEPRGGGGITLVITYSDSGTIRDGFKAATFLTQEQLEQEAKWREEQERREPDENLERQMQLYELTLVHDVNLVTWSVEKMREVIKLCDQLVPKKTRAKVVRAFESPFREVPAPHTWGEVALVKARMVAGSWQPGRQVWLKVMYGKELLGEGRLNKGWYVGEDKSDLPQTESKRPQSRECEVETEPVQYVEEREEIYGVEILISKPAQVKTEQQIRDALRQAKERLWAAVEDLFERACRELGAER